MQHWTFSLRTKTLAAMTFLAIISIAIVPQVVTAQGRVYVPVAALQTAPDLRAKPEKGESFERKRMWGKALAQYENLLRSHPDDAVIKGHAARARVCVDVARRHADPSYVSSVRKFDLQHALNVNREVLDLISSSFVHTPNWSQVVELGNDAINTALSEPAFVSAFLQGIPASQISSFRHDLRRVADPRTVRTQRDALQRIAATGKLAQQRLGIAPEIIMEYACSAIGALDPYSAYLTDGQLEEIFSQIEGNFVGLGFELKDDGDALLIVSVIEGSPAKAAGLINGDRLVRVGGRLVADVSPDRAAEMLKGTAGSAIKVVAERSGHDPLEFRLVRRRIDVPSVEDVKIVDADKHIGYFRLSSFQKTTNRDVDEALWALHRKGMRSLIIDLRGNPGGLLDASVAVADKFLTRGMIVSTRGRGPQEDKDYRAHLVGTWSVPLAVLIDGDTASASEILAAAIHDHHRGTVVGERSYGKGSVQGIFDLSQTKAGVRLTVAKFYSPDGTAISDHGVVPNVAVRIVAKPAGAAILTPDPDPVLQAGINKLASRAVSSR